ncbi:MAG: hypothetical protein ACK55I_04795, partial [bacterium]
GAAASFIFITPIKGNNTNGNKAVMAMGTASVIHQMMIHAASDKTLPAEGDINESGMMGNKIKKTSGPAIKPINFCQSIVKDFVMVI